MAGSGLPGLSRLDHLGFSVPDLEQATEFLVDVLGCEHLTLEVTDDTAR